MESQNMDKQFKKIIEGSEDHYKEHSDRAKSYIWNEIKKGEHKTVSVMWRYLAIAVSILLLFSISFGFYFSKKQSNDLVSSFSNQIEQLKKQNVALKLQPRTITKTITVEKEHIVKVPVVKTEIVEKVDTVFVKQVVFEYIDEAKEKTEDKVMEEAKEPVAFRWLPQAYLFVLSPRLLRYSARPSNNYHQPYHEAGSNSPAKPPSH